MLGLCTIKTMKLILVIAALVSPKFSSLFSENIKLIFLIQFAAASAESWTGEGFARCYGELNILAARPDWNDVNGIAQCRPKPWNGASDPQAIFITGNDGTEYVR